MKYYWEIFNKNLENKYNIIALSERQECSFVNLII